MPLFLAVAFVTGFTIHRQFVRWRSRRQKKPWRTSGGLDTLLEKRLQRAKEDYKFEREIRKLEKELTDIVDPNKSKPLNH